jgi:molybdopterin biosynthesis enzyme
VSADSFAIRAARLAGMAGAVLGWQPEEFWAATPAELKVIFQVFAGDSTPDVHAGGGDLVRLMEMFPDG